MVTQINLKNADKFLELTKKYNFDTIDDMLNKMFPILEWALIHEVTIHEDNNGEND